MRDVRNRVCWVGPIRIVVSTSRSRVGAGIPRYRRVERESSVLPQIQVPPLGSAGGPGVEGMPLVLAGLEDPCFGKSPCAGAVQIIGEPGTLDLLAKVLRRFAADGERTEGIAAGLGPPAMKPGAEH